MVIDDAIFEVIRIDGPSQLKLANVVHACDCLSLALGSGKGWKHHTGQNADDADDHQQFNQGKSAPLGAMADSSSQSWRHENILHRNNLWREDPFRQGLIPYTGMPSNPQVGSLFHHEEVVVPPVL